MHLIRFRLGLRPRSRWGSLHRSPDPLAVFKGPTSKGREGRGRKGGQGGEGRDQEKGQGIEGERGREGRGRGDRDGRESLGGKGKGRERVGKKEWRENLGGPGPHKCFFLEPRLPVGPIIRCYVAIKLILQSRRIKLYTIQQATKSPVKCNHCQSSRVINNNIDQIHLARL